MLTEWERLWRFRAVVQVLVARDLKVRYHGTAFGFLWSFLNPLIFVTVYVVVFSLYLRVDVDNYPAFLICGLLPWGCLVASVIESSRAIIDNGPLVKKTMLPAEVFPLVSLGTNLTHFLLTVPPLLLALLLLGVPLSWPVLFLPAIVITQLLLMLGLGLLCSSFAVRFRDLLHIVPNLLLIWFFLTPILYPESMVPSDFRGFLIMNPMAHLIDAYRNVLLYRQPPQALPFSLLFCFAVILALAAYRIFSSRRDGLVEEL